MEEASTENIIRYFLLTFSETVLGFKTRFTLSKQLAQTKDSWNGNLFPKIYNHIVKMSNRSKKSKTNTKLNIGKNLNIRKMLIEEAELDFQINMKALILTANIIFWMTNTFLCLCAFYH